MADINCQVREAKLAPETIKSRLAGLQPEIAWCHRFDFAPGLATLYPNDRNYTKANGLTIIGRMIIESIPYITKKGHLDDISVLDLACAEGAHSIEFAAAGAKRVLGIEGRQIYVDRATFVAEAYGLNNVSFRLGDVRAISAEDPGTFDVVLFLGIPSSS